MVDQEPNFKHPIVILTIGLLALVYLLNLGANDIWNPNEGFYADAAREMFKSNNFLEFYFNQELRFNKPPLTYWSVALSVALFGLNEFAIRLPMAVMALITIYLTYLIGNRLFTKKEGMLSAIIMALSLQFTVNARYSSPEIPLTCFFTLTMYWFIKGYLDKRLKYLTLAYLAFGLTLLAKGYPYLIIIGAIIALYLLVDSEFKFKPLWQKIKLIRPEIGLPIVILVGFSWPAYMYWLHGDLFFEVLNAETVDRAFNYDSKGLSSLFFYIEISSWGFLPYSLVFFYALFSFIRTKKWRELAFPISWLVVMFVIFTLAKGKLPTYFIQAHTAMSIVAARFLAINMPQEKLDKVVYYITLGLPSVLILLLNIGLVVMFDINFSILLLVFLPITILILLLNPGQRITQSLLGMLPLKSKPFWQYFKILPFYSFLVSMLLFSAFIMPQLETYRPYDQIKVAVEEQDIDPEVSLWLQDQLLFNLPYYVQRKVVNSKTIAEIQEHVKNKPQSLVLVSEENIERFPDSKLLWKGWVYKRNSEAKFFRFVTGYLKAKEGDFSDYRRLCLIYKDQHISSK